MHIDWFVFIPCVLCNQGADDKVIGKLIVVIIIGELFIGNRIFSGKVTKCIKVSDDLLAIDALVL